MFISVKWGWRNWLGYFCPCFGVGRHSQIYTHLTLKHLKKSVFPHNMKVKLKLCDWCFVMVWHLNGNCYIMNYVLDCMNENVTQKKRIGKEKPRLLTPTTTTIVWKKAPLELQGSGLQSQLIWNILALCSLCPAGHLYFSACLIENDRVISLDGG